MKACQTYKGKEYDLMGSFIQNVAVVVKDRLWGAIDVDGNIVLDITYDHVYDLHNNYFVIAKDSFWGAADAKGNIVVELIYDDVNQFESNRFLVLQDYKWGDEKGKICIDLIYDKIRPFSDGVAVFEGSISNGIAKSTDVRQGAIDLDGNIILEAK